MINDFEAYRYKAIGTWENLQMKDRPADGLITGVLVWIEVLDNLTLVFNRIMYKSVIDSIDISDVPLAM